MLILQMEVHQLSVPRDVNTGNCIKVRKVIESEVKSVQVVQKDLKGQFVYDSQNDVTVLSGNK